LVFGAFRVLQIPARASFLSIGVLLMLLLGACDWQGTETDAARRGFDSEVQASAIEQSEIPASTPAAVLSRSADGADVAAAERSGAALSVGFDEMVGTLGSHRLTVEVSFEGQDAAGAPVTFEWRTHRTIAVDPPGYRLEVSAVGDAPEAGVQSLVIVNSGDLSYLDLPGIGCISGVAGEFADYGYLPLEAAELLDGLS
jgi:hypothetical protein